MFFCKRIILADAFNQFFRIIVVIVCVVDAVTTEFVDKVIQEDLFDVVLSVKNHIGRIDISFSVFIDAEDNFFDRDP